MENERCNQYEVNMNVEIFKYGKNNLNIFLTCIYVPNMRRIMTLCSLNVIF